ncbi:major facilitator superfamily transporter [Botrytis cinerea]
MASNNLPRAFGNGDDEKEVVGLHENVPSPDPLPLDPDAHLSDEEKAAIDRKLVRKLDWTLIPWNCMGLCMTFMGFVTNWSGLMAARFFLGLAEAGLFPGISYYLSCWYKRSEFGVRIAIFFSAAAVSGSFGGLLAAAIVKMDGLGGLHGWAWIFILEGIVTVLAGIASFWLVYDFPEKARFLCEADRNRVIRRLQANNQAAGHEDFNTKIIWQAFKDYKTWLAMTIYSGCSVSLYAFSLFLPTIITQLGYTTTRAQLLSVPPYVAAAILTVVIGFLADRTAQRGLFNIIMSSFAIAGFAMLLGSEQPGVKYAGTFLGALGIYPCVANTISWISNNIEGSYKRGVVLGMMIGWVIFVASSARTSISKSLDILPATLGERDAWVEGLNDAEKEGLGDKRPDFLYTL